MDHISLALIRGLADIDPDLPARILSPEPEPKPEPKPEPEPERQAVFSFARPRRLNPVRRG